MQIGACALFLVGAVGLLDELPNPALQTDATLAFARVHAAERQLVTGSRA